MVVGGSSVSENGSSTPRFGEITKDFGDGAYVFRMTLGGIRELQDKCKIGAPEILLRVMLRRWFVDDIREIIRLALIGGGGVKPVDALKLVERYVDGRPYYESVPLAVEILSKVLLPPPSEKKTEEADEKEPPIDEMELLKLFSLPGFMATAPLSDTLPPKSTI